MRYTQLLVLCTIIASAVSASATDAKGNAPSEKRAGDTALDRPELQLKKAMSVGEVIKIMGQPRDRTPLKPPTGKAEIWVYSRQISDVSTQVEVGSKPITDTVVGGDGKARTVVVSSEPIFKNAHMITDEEVSLLMFNDHFVQAKITQKRRREMN